jgi:hypothetical protein
MTGRGRGLTMASTEISDRSQTELGPKFRLQGDTTTMMVKL